MTDDRLDPGAYAAALQGKPLTIAGVPYVPAVSCEARGCWVAYYHDRSGAWIFDSEIEALRCAVGKSTAVAFWPFGVDLSEIPK